MKVYPSSLTFDWDQGNIEKNYLKHHITPDVAEEAFADESLLTFPDPTHSQTELRYHLIGKDKSGDILFISYTIRGKKIRVISARLASKKERKVYAKKT